MKVLTAFTNRLGNRGSNQDRCLVLERSDRVLVAVADGMGGHRAGEVASRIAADRALAELRVAQAESVADTMAGLLRIGQAVEAANQALLDTCIARPELNGMGTTMVVAAFRDHRLFYAHVGDSRLYRIRFGRMRRLTHDHSLIQRMVDEGVFLNRTEARQAGVPDNVLTRGLGLQHHAEVDVGDALLESGDTYLVCSEGLHGLISDNDIARILRDPGGDLTEGFANPLPPDQRSLTRMAASAVKSPCK